MRKWLCQAALLIRDVQFPFNAFLLSKNNVPYLAAHRIGAENVVLHMSRGL